ncbi:unnamed protein product [Vitrella brassicaformis CCMP3155]|uniref:NAD(P)-binding domain-containing protein n=1 Tax=Vitrella brassicaformis (strain CCMP3155) TaxID=1169540 RepID=A0A0G4F6T6_VITBC|nr:unnamed protein product [Vitrella brassicaformis CCMP3155]|eukprot:CEM07838.1 unnamed protein product [Vitrella brassicaformis CCMP3155]
MLVAASENDAFSGLEDELRRQRLMVVPKDESPRTKNVRRGTRWRQRRRERLDRIQSNKRAASTYASRLWDDFLNKRLGQGEQYYGKRTSDMSQEEFLSTQWTKSQTELALEEEKPLLPDAVLLVASEPDGELCTATVSLLRNRGFNVRLLVPTSDMQRIEKRYGGDGDYIDVMEGDAVDVEDAIEAAMGSQALVYLSENQPGQANREYAAVAALRQAAEASGGPSGPATVKKFVLISSASVASGNQGVGAAFNALLGNPTGWKLKAENELRGSGSALPYVILRPTSFQDEQTNAYARANMAWLTRDILVAQEGPLGGLPGVSRIDVAEAVVQTLMRPLAGVTFSFTNGPNIRMPKTFDESISASGLSAFEREADELWGDLLRGVRTDAELAARSGTTS